MFIAIVISALGMFAMSLYYSNQQMKSIAIRKVFGASVHTIIFSLVNNLFFSKTVCANDTYLCHNCYPYSNHRSNHFPQQLSGGQQQRVAIARAIISKPSVILADEPTGNLDSKNGMEVMNLLSELNREGTTIIMVTHSKLDASYAGRIIYLFDGEIVKDLVL